MRKDQINGKLNAKLNGQGKSENASETTPPSVTVMDRFPLYQDPESCPDSSEELSLEERNIKALRVLIKRSLPLQKPAPDLLVRIHQKIDALREED